MQALEGDYKCRHEETTSVGTGGRDYQCRHEDDCKSRHGGCRSQVKAWQRLQVLA